MSRTDLDPASLAKALRRMAGDGGMEWCCEPIQASVLLDVADMLDENDRLRGLFNETLIRLVAASEAAGGGFMDARYCELLESHGIEVIE